MMKDCNLWNMSVVFRKFWSIHAHCHWRFHYLVVSTATFLMGVATNFQTNISTTNCDIPVIEPDNFHQYVTVLVGSNCTFSCVIHSDTPLMDGYPKWTKLEPFPDHVISNTKCPTLSNTTCSNLTLINVSQSDGSGYYTITAENECGSDNFTVDVLVMSKLCCISIVCMFLDMCVCMCIYMYMCKNC